MPDVNVWVQAFAGRPNLALQWFDPTTRQRKTKSTGTSDPQEAERQRRDHEHALRHGTLRAAPKGSWSEFRAAFEHEFLAGRRATTREKYGSVLDVFEQIARPARLADLTERAISRFAAGLRIRVQANGRVGLAPYTIRNYLVALRTTLKWGVQQKLLAELPEFPVVRVPKKKPQPVSGEDFQALLAAADTAEWKGFLLTAWWSGLRFSEALQLRAHRSDRWPWLDLAGDRLVLPAEFAKSAEDQWVPLHPTLRDALVALEPDAETGRLFAFRSRNHHRTLTTRNTIGRRVKAFAQRAGVRLTMHTLRRGFGCRVAQQLGRGNAPILHRLMRHTSMQITLEFYASTDPVLHEAMNELK